jgi:hypothetical protein
MTAVNPQITKSYAAQDYDYVFPLIKKASRMSFYLLALLALPIIFNVELLLSIWLKEVPEHSGLFVQLFLIFAMSESISQPLITAMLATGRIRNYQLVVGGIQLLNIPISYICLRAGAIPEITVVVAIALSQVCLFARLIMFGRVSGFSVPEFIRKVYLNVLKVLIVSILLPLTISFILPEGWQWSVLNIIVCVLWTGGVILFMGCDKNDRKFLLDFLRRRKGE